jgi:predicted PurR-regulated permease PerM
MLVGAGLYILANYLRALAWALILAVALCPFYDHVRRRTSPALAKENLPILFTAVVGSVVIVPVVTLAVEAIREFREIVDYGRSLEESGMPVPDFVARLPYGGQWVADWWHEHLSHAGWAKAILRQVTGCLNNSSAHGLYICTISVPLVEGEGRAGRFPRFESALPGREPRPKPCPR